MVSCRKTRVPIDSSATNAFSLPAITWLFSHTNWPAASSHWLHAVFPFSLSLHAMVAGKEAQYVPESLGFMAQINQRNWTESLMEKTREPYEYLCWNMRYNNQVSCCVSLLPSFWTHNWFSLGLFVNVWMCVFSVCFVVFASRAWEDEDFLELYSLHD